MQGRSGFVLFHGKRQPETKGPIEIKKLLSFPATEREMSAATRNQTMPSRLFLYKHVLGIALPWLDEAVQAKSARELPVVLSAEAVRALPKHKDGTTGLMARLLHSTGDAPAGGPASAGGGPGIPTAENHHPGRERLPGPDHGPPWPADRSTMRVRERPADAM